MSFEELMEFVEGIKLPDIDSSMEITRPHTVLSEGGSRSLLGDEACKSNVLGKKDDRVLLMFCCDT